MNPLFRLRDPRLCQIAVLTGLMVFGTTVLDLGIRWQNAIGSKFLIRIRGKHVFNPANVALVLLVLALIMHGCLQGNGEALQSVFLAWLASAFSC